MTQSYQEHVQRAIANGWCYQPGAGCKIYYYGGIDYGCPKGTKIVASVAHTCEVIKQDFGYGYHVKGKAGDVTLIYAHLSHISVRNGETVDAGELIGLSGGIPGEPGAGNSTGAHLHYELRIKGIPTDPAPYIIHGITPTPIPGGGIDFKYGDKIRLRPAYSYVNIRTKPDMSGLDVGDFMAGDTATVLGVDTSGQWVLIFDQWRVQLWLNANYVEKV